MAIMIPAQCDLSRRPISEQFVFDVIKSNLSNDWKVFHSFDFLARDLSKKIWDGEIDFLLYNSAYGFVVIEVKGGVISFNNGQWYQEDRRIDPFGQAKRNKYAVYNLLKEKLNKPISQKFAHTVCFPICDDVGEVPPEAMGIIITKSTLNNLEPFLINLLNETPSHCNTIDTVTEFEVMQVLSPMFEYGSRLFERISIEDKQFFLFTESQCEILNALENFKRLQICGCAGSGKTVMAVKKAQKLALEGKSVLLLCYNELLAAQLKTAVKDYPQIKAAAFFDYCIETIGVPQETVEKYKDNPRMYSEVLPKFFSEHIKNTVLCYDAVIVDEGQDFTPEAWSAISLLPEENGVFYIFYDPDQNIYTQELNLPDFGIPPVVLNKNCRNTKRIFEAIKPYQSLDCSTVENAPVGTYVRRLYGNCREYLEDELEMLVKYDRVSLNEIVILGAHKLSNTSIGDNPKVGRFLVVSNTNQLKKREVKYFTYMKYKGCEAKVVILLDVDENDPRWSDKHGMYTAMSRAKHKLIMLYKNKKS